MWNPELATPKHHLVCGVYIGTAIWYINHLRSKVFIQSITYRSAVAHPSFLIGAKHTVTLWKVSVREHTHPYTHRITQCFHFT